MSNHFRLELIESSIFWTLVEKEERVTRDEMRREHGSNLTRLETVSELKKTVDPQPL